MAKKEEPKCNVDPVCNMDLTAEHGKFAYDFEEETYYFCSELCKKSFVANPAQYVQRTMAAQDMSGSHAAP